MPDMRVILEGDGCWPDLVGKEAHTHRVHGFDVAALKGGMKSGKPSVAIRIDTPQGDTIIAETSMQLFISAARAFEARFEEEMK